MAVAVVAFFKETVIKEIFMNQKKTAIISILVQLVLAAAVAAAFYKAWDAKLDPTTIAYRMYVETPAAWPVRCWHDALFSTALIWLGIGGMMFVAATDFFDIFGYAFSSLLVLFSPLKSPKEQKKFYEYKQDRNEKRKKKADERKNGNLIPTTMVIIGVVLLVAAIAVMFVHDSMLPADAFDFTDAYESTEYDGAQAGDELELPLQEERVLIDNTTGGENNE